jgi:xanthine dehydrogenase iron-sulfur cluster and FAD-binding subunit A
MSTAQLIIIGVGVLIALSSIDLSFLIKKLERKVQPSVSKEEKNDLIEIVQKWDDLRTICNANGLTEATKKLDEIFPMLIKMDK